MQRHLIAHSSARRFQLSDHSSRSP
jgi:hypothetical protein